MPKTNCCNSCSAIETDRKGRVIPYAFFCSNPNCKCHGEKKGIESLHLPDNFGEKGWTKNPAPQENGGGKCKYCGREISYDPAEAKDFCVGVVRNGEVKCVNSPQPDKGWEEQLYKLVKEQPLYPIVNVEELKSFISQLLKEAELRGIMNGRDIYVKAITNGKAQARQETYEEIWDILIESLPADAENLSQTTPDQAKKVLNEFMRRLQERK